MLAILRREWEAGTSTRKIGAMLGISCNVVCKKARHIGLERRPNPVTPGVTKKPAAPVRLGKSSAAIFDEPAPRRRREELDCCQHVEMHDGKWLPCGLPVARGSYCEAHAAVFYVQEVAR